MRAALVLAAGALVLAGCTSSTSGPTLAAPIYSTPLTAPPSVVTVHPAPKGLDWPTYHGDPARTGVSCTFPAPTKLAVTAALQLDAAVYAS